MVVSRRESSVVVSTPIPGAICTLIEDSMKQQQLHVRLVCRDEYEAPRLEEQKHFTISAAQRQYILAGRGSGEETLRASSPPKSLLAEAQRLTLQHYVYKKACDGIILLTPAEELLRGTAAQRNVRVMDVGTGTAIWLHDLHASGIVPSLGLQLHGCDLELGLAQMSPDTLGKNHIIQHNVLAPFDHGVGAERVGQVGSYDLVHARLLVYALEQGKGWTTAVENMVALLRPGGVLHLSELNAAGYQPARTPCSRARTATTAVDTLNAIAAQALKSLGKDQFAGDHVANHLRAAGLRNVTTRRFKVPFGKCSAARGWTSKQTEQANATALGAIAALKMPFLAAGGDRTLGITTEADFDAWYERLKLEVDMDGMYFEFTMACGEKAA